MKVSSKPFDLSSLVISQEQLQPRTPGTHVSSVVRKMSRAMGKRDGDFTDEQLDRFAVVGRLFERLLADIWFKPPRYQRVGEIEMDNIIGSPDSIDTEQWSILEFKCTWVSCGRIVEIDGVRKCPDFEGKQKFWEYVAQAKSYCVLIGTPRATVIVLFLCGDWKPPVPEAFEWNLLFTPQELNEWKKVMAANR